MKGLLFFFSRVKTDKIGNACSTSNMSLTSGCPSKTPHFRGLEEFCRHIDIYSYSESASQKFHSKAGFLTLSPKSRSDLVQCNSHSSNILKANHLWFCALGAKCRPHPSEPRLGLFLGGGNPLQRVKLQACELVFTKPVILKVSSKLVRSIEGESLYIPPTRAHTQHSGNA